ncbi:MAG: helix-turn-helix domain-containing protein [Solirubrobacterales bacterium]
MIDPVSIPEAAKALELSPSRMQALVVHGQVPGVKIGGRWLIERGNVERRRRQAGLKGRPFAAHNAWALLCLASGKDPDGIDPSVRSRLRRAIALEGLEKLGPRLARRAESRHFNAHPGEIPHIPADPRFVGSGISAAGAYEFDLAAGAEADGYLRASALEKFAAAHALRPAGPGANLHLRLVPDKAWRFLEGARVAPIAAVALDLAADPDPRSSQTGRAALHDLEPR